MTDPDSNLLREKLLNSTLQEVKRVRRNKRITRTCGLLVIPLLLAVLVARQQPIPDQEQERATPAPSPLPIEAQTIPGTEIEVIDDTKLESLLGDHAFAIIGQKGNQRLILLE